MNAAAVKTPETDIRELLYSKIDPAASVKIIKKEAMKGILKAAYAATQTAHASPAVKGARAAVKPM